MLDFSAIKDSFSFLKRLNVKTIFIALALGVVLFFVFKNNDFFKGSFKANMVLIPHWEVAEDVMYKCREKFNPSYISANYPGIKSISFDKRATHGVNPRRSFAIESNITTNDSINISLLQNEIVIFCDSVVKYGKEFYKGREVLRERLRLIDSTLISDKKELKGDLKSLVNMEWEVLALKTSDNLLLMKGRYLGELNNFNTINYLSYFSDNYTYKKSQYASLKYFLIFFPLVIYMFLLYVVHEVKK